MILHLANLHTHLGWRVRRKRGKSTPHEAKQSKDPHAANISQLGQTTPSCRAWRADSAVYVHQTEEDMLGGGVTTTTRLRVIWGQTRW